MDGRICYVIHEVSNNLARSWSIGSIANLVGLSIPHLHKLFKQEMQVSPMAYVHQMRMERVQQLLSDPQCFLLIKEICVLAGLKDVSHLTRDFKELFGVSPTKFRKETSENYWINKGVKL